MPKAKIIKHEGEKVANTKQKFKVSKITLSPSRKINLGNYNTVELNAGIEIVFDEAVEIGSEELKKAYEQGRKILREEFIEQYKPYVNFNMINADKKAKK